MKTSIVIATYNKLEFTQKCVESIRQYTQFGTYEIIIVDNDSTDGTQEWVLLQDDITSILNDENLGFPKACNQGIVVATGDNILLLNNDVIVTYKWLENLTECLVSSEDIGAVGAVTNYCSNYQTISVNYQTIEEMQQFAQEYNKSKFGMWEERLRLIAYCMLIRKNVVDEIGILDERFSPGNFEDDDYSLRIRNAGYKLMLCMDTFIHHFGSISFKENPKQYVDLMSINKKKFIEKWGFDPETEYKIRYELIQLINKPNSAKLKILEIGCGCGGTLLKIKSIFTNAELHGIESNIKAADVAGTFAQVLKGCAETLISSYPERFFDIIIVDENFYKCEDLTSLLIKLRYYLKDEGDLLAVVPNLLHFHVIRNIITGRITRKQLGYYKLSEIETIFKEAGFVNLYMTGTTIGKNTEDENFINEIVRLSELGITEPYEVYQFLIRAKQLIGG